MKKLNLLKRTTIILTLSLTPIMLTSCNDNKKIEDYVFAVATRKITLNILTDTKKTLARKIAKKISDYVSGSYHNPFYAAVYPLTGDAKKKYDHNSYYIYHQNSNVDLHIAAFSSVATPYLCTLYYRDITTDGNYPTWNRYTIGNNPNIFSGSIDIGKVAKENSVENPKFENMNKFFIVTSAYNDKTGIKLNTRSKTSGYLFKKGHKYEFGIGYAQIARYAAGKWDINSINQIGTKKAEVIIPSEDILSNTFKIQIAKDTPQNNSNQKPNTDRHDPLAIIRAYKEDEAGLVTYPFRLDGKVIHNLDEWISHLEEKRS